MNQMAMGILEWNGDFSHDNRWFASGGTYEWVGGTALDWLTGQRSAEWLTRLESDLRVRHAPSMWTSAVIPDVGRFEFAPDSRSLVTQAYGYGAITIYDLPLRHSWRWIAVAIVWLTLLTAATVRYARPRKCRV
jgi:hypothetical protein